MFAPASIIFIIFTLLYGLLTAAIIYHLRQYTLPGHTTPRMVLTIFLFLASLLWLFALFFLFQIPR